MYLINTFLCLLALSYGSFIGSFIIRFPEMIDKKSEVTIYSPRSSCQECRKTLNVYMLIPLISYIYQKGKCSLCKQPINRFYFINELFHLLLMILIVGFIPITGDFFKEVGLVILFFLIISSLYAQFIIDLKHLSLSVYLSLKLIILGILLNLFFEFFTGLNSSIIGAIIGYLSLYFLNKLFYFFSKKEGIGGGDFILLASAGALFGYQMLSFVVLLGSLISLLIYLFNKSDYKGKVPFGSGIALASFFIIIIQITLLKSIL